MLHSSHLILALLIMVLAQSTSCDRDPVVIVPEAGYAWPSQDREYWPTDDWIMEPMEDHEMDAAKMEIADQFAADDHLARALLVVKDGYLVYENYYGDGGIDESTNLWSVTKSVSSILVGMLMDDDYVASTNQLMAELMPAYPEFDQITLQHVLTMTTGLSWAESGPLWTQWIFSDDWVAAALARGQDHDPGERFYYSSGNSHFLTALVYFRTGMTPGRIAMERLFRPLGIPFDTLDHPVNYQSWSQYITPLPQSWRRDPMGIETASFSLYLTARDMAKLGFLYLNRGLWEDQEIVSEDWVRTSTKDHETDIYGRYSYGYQWYITFVAGEPAFLASGFGGQIIGVVPSLDLVVVLKYEAESPEHPVPGTEHDDMHLFELVVNAAKA